MTSVDHTFCRPNVQDGRTEYPKEDIFTFKSADFDECYYGARGGKVKFLKRPQSLPNVNKVVISNVAEPCGDNID